MRGGTQPWETNGPPRRWRRGLVSKVVMGNRDERGGHIRGKRPVHHSGPIRSDCPFWQVPNRAMHVHMFLFFSREPVCLWEVGSTPTAWKPI